MGTAQHPWEVLTGLPAWQITEVPRPPGGDGDGRVRDDSVPQRVAALMSASVCRAPLAIGWLRDVPSGPVRVLAMGPGLSGGRENGHAVLTLPAGARARPLPGGAVPSALAALPCWTPVAGATDALLADHDGHQRGELEVPPSLEDGLLSVWLDVFGWVLVAEPVPTPEINELAAQAASEQLAAEQNSAPRSRLAARRVGARHDELRQAISAGLWRVRLLAGASSPDAARRVAALVCGSADLRGLPYTLHPGQETGPLPEMLTFTAGQRPPRNPFEQAAPQPDRTWWDTPLYLTQPGRAQPGGAPGLAEASRIADDERDTPVPGFPFTASTRLVAAICRAPVIEVPGLRFTLRPAFDVTPEVAVGEPASPAITAGEVLDRNRVPAGLLTLPLASLNRHVFVTGATGAGKSQTVRHLLEQAAHAGIPWLVVEPAKAEYQLMAARLPGTEVIGIRPGDLDVPPPGLNPLEPAPGPGGDRFPLQPHADLVRDLFLAAFQTSDAVKLSSCLGKFLRVSGEGDVLVVVLAGDQAVVEAAEHAAEQVALGGGVPVAGVAPAVVVAAGPG